MKKVLLIAPLLIAITAPATTPPRAMQTISFQGVPVELVFRSLQPGEVILAEMKSNPSVKKLILQVQDQQYVLDGSKPGARAFALIGIDVELKPQPLTVGVTEEKTDGTVERYQEEIAIESREFPKRNFYVNEAMLNPPPAEEERVRREQELVTEVYSVITPEWLGTGNFLSPLPDREPFPNFGQLRIYNKKRLAVHAGVDIAAPWGSPVKASNAGRVVLASNLYLSGKTVIIDHGRGVFSLYCHFSTILVKRGDMVKKGQIIAKIGNTGRSTGPHLHWGFKVFNSRVDPESILSLPLTF
jgi:murein DD-endopeptidase MepM/ murein hydrolase activator NlpD